MRNKSFHQFVQTKRNPKATDALATLAEEICQDSQFPRFSTEYNEISRYLEDSVNYVQSMDHFDVLWQQYEENT
ncbi:YozE family protein [Vagococcus elongatus]|uniref:YozE SAM-like domain-containing protein n=1 Tax=Vagococcus elongatus TaxID=180344 RepID=A0A430B5P0_9ENTE|nr:YozE family protein [Vagococcus elongatus]RSU15615.1 hypothetical protein CBF29_00640 [Vagococcus elongatus]